jgi:hypothetical protein
MIRFSCPTCKKVLQGTAQQGGQKIACPGCGQRLQIPTPRLDKTVLAGFVSENDAVDKKAASGRTESSPSPEKSAAWFYAHKGQRQGPVTFGDLQKLAVSQLDSKTLVWTTGMAEWVKAKNVSGLSFARRVKSSRCKSLAWGSFGLMAAACGLVAIFLGVRDFSSAFAGPSSTGESGQVAKGAKTDADKSRHVQPKPRQDPAREAQEKARKAIAAKLTAVGKEYAVLLDRSVKVQEDALREEPDAGQASQALFIFRKQIASRLPELAAALKEADDARAERSPGQNAPTNQDKILEDLSRNCREMKDLLEGKWREPMTPASYAEKVKSLMHEFEELSRKL